MGITPFTDTHRRFYLSLQEKRRAERAEQQRIRNEREKERQNRLAVSDSSPVTEPLKPKCPL